MECRRRCHPNWRGTREGTVDDLAFARAINADVDTESFGGGRLVILIDQAHQLSGAPLMCCMTNGTPPRKSNLHSLHHRYRRDPAESALAVSSAGSWTRGGCITLVLLRNICEKEGFTHRESTLDLFARRAGGHVRQMIQDLEGLAEQGTITLEQVRTFYEADGAHQISLYIERLLYKASLEQQMQALDAWDALPERKLSGIEAYLAELFGTEVLQGRAPRNDSGPCGLCGSRSGCPAIHSARRTARNGAAPVLSGSLAILGPSGNCKRRYARAENQRVRRMLNGPRASAP